MVFVDTSALFSLIDVDDLDHLRMNKIWRSLLLGDHRLVTSNYVLLEASALGQRRHGMQAVLHLFREFTPVLSVEWIAEATHQAALSDWTDANRTKLSLVDCTSFQVMREQGIRRAFTLDRHFREQGFQVIP